MATTQDMTPVEIDTELARIYNEQIKLQVSIRSHGRLLDQLKSRRRHPPVQDIENVAAYIRRDQDALQDLYVESAPYQIEYRRRPWNRYYLVTNANGHVH